MKYFGLRLLGKSSGYLAKMLWDWHGGVAQVGVMRNTVDILLGLTSEFYIMSNGFANLKIGLYAQFIAL